MEVVSLQKGKTVSLAKGQKVSLSKDMPGLNEVIIGLGWDPVDKAETSSGGGFLSKLFKKSEPAHSNQDIDCDAFAVALKQGHYKQDNLLYYGRKSVLGGALVHTGDNLTGEGDGDDEQLIIKLKDMPNMVDRIVIAVTIYMGRSRHQHFGNIQNAYIRLEDCRDHNEMCRYELSNNAEYSGYVTVHFGDLVHTENGWEFEAVGKADEASDIGAFAEKYS